MIAGNESKLHQALLSILSNAVQSIENEGMINIQTTKQNNRLLITIIDS
jgi:signal transduction histidine kinase